MGHLGGYPETSIAQIAETTLGDWRLVVRRVRRLSQQGELLPVWDHYPFATNRTDTLTMVEAEHRKHAVVELAIRDLKDQALAHFPSGQFNANAAWTVIAALAHNLLRWTQTIGLPNAPPGPRTRYAADCSRCPDDSCAPRGAQHYGCPPAGPGPMTSSPRSRDYARSRHPTNPIIL